MEKLASFFTEIGFKVDEKGFDSIRSKFAELKKLSSEVNGKFTVAMQGAVKKSEQVSKKLKKQSDVLQNSHVAAFQKQLSKDQDSAIREDLVRLRDARKQAESLQKQKDAAIKAETSARIKSEKAVTREQERVRRESARAETARIRQLDYERKLADRRETNRIIQQGRDANTRLRHDLKLEEIASRPGRMRGAGFLGGVAGVASSIAGPALAGLGAWEVGSGIFKAVADKQRALAALTATTGGKENAAIQYKYLNDEVDRLSLNLEAATKGFVMLKGSAMGSEMAAEDVNKLFSSTSELMRVYGLSADDQLGAFRALGQMMSKTTITAEELNCRFAA